MSRLPRSNMLQSLQFARATRILDKKVTRHAVIEKDGEPAGIMSIQEIKLGPLHVIDLYRGPLWFSENPSLECLREFAIAFNSAFPRRPLRRRRWLPEWEGDEQSLKVITESGFKPKPMSFETIWLDLTKPEPNLRAQMQQKWRASLNKGERENLEIIQDWTGSTGKAFLQQYAIDKELKKYRGRSPRFVAAELALALRNREAVFLWACQDKLPVAGILLMMHGSSATYRIGWTTTEGRKANAHNVMLWEAAKLLKARGVKTFDLGGIEPHGAEGLTAFKAGMGGERLKLPGIFG
jgi:hypothetical protein